MAVNLTAGEIYFIREQDVLTKEISKYIKVGLIRDGEDKSSELRAAQHQTGNPRKLLVEHTVKTEAVSAVENMLHDHFATQRISGEWFKFDDAELAACKELAKVLAKQAAKSVKVFAKAATLKDQVSTANVIDPTKEIEKTYREYLDAQACFDFCQDLLERVKDLLVEAYEEDDGDEGVVTQLVKKQQKKAKLVFDKIAFELSYPEIYKKYVGEKITISGAFKITPLKGVEFDIAIINPALNDLVIKTEQAIVAVEAKKLPAEELHELNLRLLGFESSVEWKMEIAKAEIQVFCGDNAEVKGICKWSRTSKGKATFDEKTLREEHSSANLEFCQEETGGTAFIINPKKPYTTK